MNWKHTQLRSFFCYGFLVSVLCFSGSAIAQRPTTQYFYDANGNVTSAVDGLNRPTVQQYDAFNRLRRITQPPPAALQPNPVIQLELNGRDDLTRVIDPRNLATDYGVTGLSDVTTQTSPDTGVTTRTFDAAGNVKTSRDARNRTTTYTYDALHRLTKALYGDATFSTYVYDQGANGVGRLTSMTDPGPITTSWTYTAMGRVATKIQTIGSGTAARTHQLIYSYNPTTGQLISMTYPSGKVITYTYGATSKDLERIAINGASAASSITYHPFGGVKRITLGNGQVWSNSLDQDGRVVNYTLAGVTYTITWDAANRIKGITSSQTATNRTFDYDNLDRITSFATTGRSQSFGYDATGNLLTKSDLIGATQTNYTFSIAPTGNRMTGIGNLGIGFSFDAAGNRTGDGRITYAYNQRGRMNQVRIINGAVTTTYNYLINGINLRVRKTGPSTVVPQGMRIFVYDDAAKPIGEYDDLGRARTEHVWLEDRPIAAITYTYTGTSTTPATTTTSYVETDHLATPRLITNASRQKRWTWESAPYGDTFPNENPQSLGAYNYNLRFPGQYFDAETNHHYNHHRDYESTSGRYLESDPIGLDGGVNTYAYVFNSPLTYTDPTGEFAPIILVPWIVNGLIGFATDVAWQMLVEGRSLECVDWWNAGVAAGASVAFSGAFTAGVRAAMRPSGYRFGSATFLRSGTQRGDYVNHSIFRSGPDPNFRIEWATHPNRLGMPHFHPYNPKIHPVVPPLSGIPIGASAGANSECQCRRP